MEYRMVTFGLAVLITALASTASPSQSQIQPSDLTSVRTYNARDFRQSPLDSLAGGLPQKIPYRMAADSQERILVTDPLQSVIHVFDIKQGKRSHIRGSPHRRLSLPAYLAVDADDNIYVSDSGLLSVLVFEPGGRYKWTIGTDVLILPTGIWVDKRAKMLYVADWWRDEILVFDLEGNLLRALGTHGKGPGQLSGPTDVVIHNETLVVLDTGNSRFELLDLRGNFRGAWPFGANRMPTAFAIDPAGNLLYVDLYSGGLAAMDPAGRVIASLGTLRSYGKSRPSGISFKCVTIDGAGHIWVLRPTLDIEALELANRTPSEPASQRMGTFRQPTAD